MMSIFTVDLDSRLTSKISTKFKKERDAIAHGDRTRLMGPNLSRSLCMRGTCSSGEISENP
jgi:hypothetical protein